MEIHNRFSKGKPCLLVGSSRDVGINQPSQGAKATTKGRTNEGAKQKAMQNPQRIIGGTRNAPNPPKYLFKK